MKQNNVDPSGDMGAISSGSGEINDTSISIGDHSIFIKNISALSVEKLPIDWNLYLLSLFIFIVGSSVWEKSFFFGGVLILTGGFLGYKNFISRNDHSLRIKVNSGGMFSIVSRDKKLLIKIRDFLLEKINFPDKLSVANFNLTDNHFHTDGGGVSIGEGSIATGRNGVFNNGAGSWLIMKNTFNSGGGGIAIGSNSVATGSNSIYSSVANHGENIKTADLSDNQILQLIKNFEDLKTVVFAKIEDQSDAVALQITALEQKIIKKEPVEHKMLGRVLSSVTDLSKAVPSVAEAVSAILKILLP